MTATAMTPGLTDWLIDLFAGLAANPVALFLAIFIATFVLEDAVTLAVGLLAGRMAIDPTLAVAATLAGTIAGDIALYAVGRELGTTAWVMRLRAKGSGRFEEAIRRRGLIAVAIARFVPGTRLPVFLASGIVRTPFVATSAVIAATALIWTPALFWLGQNTGNHLLAMATPLNVALALALVAGAFLAPRVIKGVAVTLKRRALLACVAA